MALNAYQRVLRKLGGKQKTLVEVSGRKQSTVSEWARRGLIPIQYVPDIMRGAKDIGCTLNAEDFLPEEEIVA